VVRHFEHLQFGLLASDHLLPRQLPEIKLLYGGGGSSGSRRRPARVAAVVGVAALTPAAAVVVGRLLLFLNLLLPRRPKPPGRLSSFLRGLLSVCIPLATDVRFVRGRGRGHVASLVRGDLLVLPERRSGRAAFLLGPAVVQQLLQDGPSSVTSRGRQSEQRYQKNS